MTRKREVERPYRPAMVSAETLAYLADCSRSTIDDYVAKGLLPEPFAWGNLKRWWWEDVEIFIRTITASANPLANGAGAVPPSEDDEFARGSKRAASSHA